MKNKSSFQNSVLGLIATATLISCADTGMRNAPVAATPPSAGLADAVTGSVNSYRMSHGTSELKRHAGLDLLDKNSKCQGPPAFDEEHRREVRRGEKPSSPAG